MSASSSGKTYLKDALGRVVPPNHPRAHEREIYLKFVRRSKWAAILDAPISHLRQLLTLALMATVGFGIGIPATSLLPTDFSWIAWLIGIVGAAGVFWYLEIVRPNRREALLHEEALRLAGASARDLQFTNGAVDDFVPKGAFTTVGGSAMGFDPKRQLLRSVHVHPLSGEIWLDWVFGLDTLGDLDIVEAPDRTLANAVRRLLGRPLRATPTLTFKYSDGRMQKLARISPKHVVTAGQLVREVNFHRPRFVNTDGKRSLT